MMHSLWTSLMTLVLGTSLLLGACASAPTPTVRPTPPTDARHVLVIAHRGGADLAPENTLAAFRNALSLGADVIEMDLHLTRDGEIVVIHDPDLTRTTDGSGAIGMMTLAEIRRYNAAAKYTGPGSWGVQPVPTLREVLDLVRPTKVQLEMEIKTPPGGRYQGIEQKVVDLLSQVGMLDRAVISSFNLDILSDLHKIAPSLRTEALVSRTTVPPGTTPQALVADVVARGVRILAPSSTFLTPELLKEAKAKGLEVRTWTVNTEGEMRLLIAMGVDGIITNRPDILREVLRR